ncbi:hypothetical protein [Flavobacterium beibuense]|uniref:hypothetical protein n=1 Tax=Flavobacterium beibuense TaxID=657326 RepID=UPI003A94D25B
MKNAFLLFFVFIFGFNGHSQTRINTEKLKDYLYCPSSNTDALEKFADALDGFQVSLTIKNYDYMGGISNRFYEAFEADSTFCDALFYAGRAALFTENKKVGIAFLYMADSLSGNKSFEFKKVLADEVYKMGTLPAMELARKKFKELIEFFPNNPEGYYSYSLTSFVLNDFDEGLMNIDKAVQLFKIARQEENVKDAYLLKGMLLSSAGRHEIAVKVFETIPDFWKMDNYKVFYCYSLVSLANGDEKKLKEAKRIYRKINNKDIIPPDFKIAFTVFED